MIEHELLADEQHGFVPGRSCCTQLLTVMEDWTKLLDRGDPVDVIYFDFTKAFDTVPHLRMLEKLGAYGIRGSTLDWIRSFLIGRRQKVKVNGKSSNWRNVTSGVPQGSVLGPLMFCIFINDIPEAVNSAMKIFADETKLYSTVTATEEVAKIQEDIDSLMKWANT